MIRLSVLYPASDGAKFDHEYYRENHVPLACRTWGLERADIDKGVTGPYVAAVHFTFESLEDMGTRMGVDGTADVLNDIPNYTDITPVQQISEMVI
jgi:uncharacterized protein (TIGR02118 family)